MTPLHFEADHCVASDPIAFHLIIQQRGIPVIRPLLHLHPPHRSSTYSINLSHHNTAFVISP